MTQQSLQDTPVDTVNTPESEQEQLEAKPTKPTRKHHHLYENINMSESTINWIIAILIILLLVAFYFALQNK